MALISCKECGNRISTEASSCPSCGAPTGKAAEAVSQKSTVLVAAALAAGVGAIFLPYFASVFFTPTAIVLGLFCISRKQRAAGLLAIALGALGVAGIISTSNKISAAQEDMQQSLEELRKAQEQLQK